MGAQVALYKAVEALRVATVGVEMVAGMSTMIRVVELSFGLLMLMRMQGSHGQTGQPEPAPRPELLQLDNILTDRINGVLKRYEPMKSTTNASREWLELYERLGKAAAMPISQLDQKILVYNEYLAYDQAGYEEEQKNTRRRDVSSEYDDIEYEDDIPSDDSEEDRRRAFEEPGIRLLQRVGRYDAFTERVFKAIFSDEKQLARLREKLNELDDDKSEEDCCLWDFIFGLF